MSTDFGSWCRVKDISHRIPLVQRKDFHLCPHSRIPSTSKDGLLLTQLGTWNALGQRLNEEKILKAVETLAKNKINITNFIIDDSGYNSQVRTSVSG